LNKENKIKPPSRIWLLVQPLAILELLFFFFSMPFLFFRYPRGNAPILILPGFLTGDWYMWPMKIILRMKGYRVYGSTFGLSMGYRGRINDGLLKRLREISEKNNNQKVALIGFSLGGIYARSIAQTCPELVSQVFTLSSPFMKISNSINIQNIYRFISGKRFEEDINLEISGRIKEKLSMPTFSIHSVFDGIVSSESCLEMEDDNTFNYKVFSTHCGLPHNYYAIKIILEKLSMLEK